MAARKVIGLHSDHLERVDLLVDAHRAELGDDAGADLGGHDVAEHVGDHLAQVTPGRKDARVGGRSDRAVEVGALDPALQAQDEDHPPDHHRRAQDQDAGLAQGLAEEAEDAAVEDVAEGQAAELDDVAEGGDPVPRYGQPAGHLGTPRDSVARGAGAGGSLDFRGASEASVIV